MRAAILLALLPACGIFQGAKALPTMDAQELDDFANYSADQLAAFTGALIETGELSQAAAIEVAGQLEALSHGDLQPLADSLLDLKPIAALALNVALNDLRYQLKRNGGLDTHGSLLPAAQHVLNVCALKVHEAALSAKEPS